MIATDKPNPFSVLGLPIGADDEQIVRRGERLADRGPDEMQRQLVAWAVETLLTHPRTRALYELFEMPDTDYEDDERWRQFVKRHSRNPVRIDDAAQSPAVAVAAFDLVALLDALIDDLRQLPDPDIARALAAAPVAPSIGPSPLEVRDVMFG